ncbi:MAG: sugar ABC transporter permease [Defluviitaleaceae bacterium]|nr:sugar ABC transporter permease [Defluviitaleaceae bacterium]MCL2238734.1 sugar ABC transporter permease [Defluviitaleaceae bacterium]
MEKAKRSKFRFTMANRNAVAGYLFIMPFVVGFLAFLARPIYQSIRMAFSYVHFGGDVVGFAMEWRGLENISRALFIDPDFNRNVVEELIRMALLVPAVLVFSLFVATLLNRKFPGRGFVRAVFFLPVILASGVLVNIETNNSLLNMVSDQIAEQNAMRAGVTSTLEMLLEGVTGAAAWNPLEYLFNIINQIYFIAMASGIQILIFLAGLQTINPSIYEAASIEGATGWENFWKITFPMISPLILVAVVYSVIDFLVRTDSEVMEQITIQIMRTMNYGFGSAMAWMYFLVIAAVLGILGLIISRLVYYYD